MHSQTHTRRPSAALIVAIVALVAALAGSAVALPGKNTVDKNDIKKNAVRAKAIKAGAVTEAKIHDAAVSTAKIADQAVSGAKLADASVNAAKLADAAVGTAKLADAAVTTAKLADAAVTQNKVGADAIDSSKVEAESLSSADLAPGVISVVAYGKIINPEGAAPTIASGAVGLTGVTGGADDDGRTTVSVSPTVLGPGNLAQCSAQVTPSATPQNNASNTLGFDTAVAAMGAPASSTAVQVQTRGAAEALNDFDYYVQVTCPNV